MNNVRRAALAAILILAVSLMSCGPLNYLQLAVGALEVALPLVGPAAGVDPQTVTAVENYAAAASDFITKAIDIEAGLGTAAQKAAQIAIAAGNIVKEVPNVPAKYAALATAVSQVAQYIFDYLDGLPTPATAHAVGGPSVKLSASDLKKGAEIRARAQAIHAKVTAKGRPQ